MVSVSDVRKIDLLESFYLRGWSSKGVTESWNPLFGMDLVLLEEKRGRKRISIDFYTYRNASHHINKHFGTTLRFPSLPFPLISPVNLGIKEKKSPDHCWVPRAEAFLMSAGSAV